MGITKIIAREISDSRGNPTVEAEAFSGGTSVAAAAPSGASTGRYEVRAFPKKGVREAVQLFNSKFSKKFEGASADYHVTDLIFREIDHNFEILGGNLAVAISFAVGKLQAKLAGKEFYEIFGNKHTMPFPLGNVIGGGAHAGHDGPDIQEFLSLPVGARTIQGAIDANLAVHKKVLELISKKIPAFGCRQNDEGGWAPKMSNETALETLANACDAVSKELGFRIKYGMDVAASQFWDAKKNAYMFRNGTKKAPEDYLAYIEDLVTQNDVCYIEDPFHEEAFGYFARFKEFMGGKCLICADDLTVTNPVRLEKCIAENSANAIIVKPNQVGSLSDTEKVIKMAIEIKYSPVVSHRSGETTDTSISHIAVGFSAPIIKCGVVGRERAAKLNELLRIAEKTKFKMANIRV